MVMTKITSEMDDLITRLIFLSQTFYALQNWMGTGDWDEKTLEEAFYMPCDMLGKLVERLDQENQKLCECIKNEV